MQNKIPINNLFHIPIYQNKNVPSTEVQKTTDEGTFSFTTA